MSVMQDFSFFLIFGNVEELMTRHLSCHLVFLSSDSLLCFFIFPYGSIDLVRMGAFFHIFLVPRQRYHIL